MCVRCGKDIRYKKKLCEKCYEEDMALRRAEGDALRSASYFMERKKVLFFDLELTGFYDRDEILSITIVDGAGELVMDTLVKPSHTKKWNRTEKIHGITPEMVGQSSDPVLEEGEELDMMVGEFQDDPHNPADADHRLVQEGYISVVAHNVDCTDYQELERIRTKF
jgi:DNA polymerase-3 subunit epsilon